MGVPFSRTLGVLAGGFLLVLGRVPETNWISRRPRRCRSGIRTARCGEVGGSGRRVIPLLGFFPPTFPLPQGSGDGASVGVLSAVRHTALVLRWAGSARCFLGGPCQARVGELGAVQGPPR